MIPTSNSPFPYLLLVRDFICNWLGNQAWTEALEWPGQKSFNKAKTQDLKLTNDKKTGEFKTSGNFTFMRIFSAGHMVPMDQRKRLFEFTFLRKAVFKVVEPGHAPSTHIDHVTFHCFGQANFEICYS